jgi:hypothetical protein
MDMDNFSYFSHISEYACGGAITWIVWRRLTQRYGLKGKDCRAELIELINEFIYAAVCVSCALSCGCIDFQPAPFGCNHRKHATVVTS